SPLLRFQSLVTGHSLLQDEIDFLFKQVFYPAPPDLDASDIGGDIQQTRNIAGEKFWSVFVPWPLAFGNAVRLQTLHHIIEGLLSLVETDEREIAKAVRINSCFLILVRCCQDRLK